MKTAEEYYQALVKGGKTVLARYGRDHYREMQKKSTLAKAKLKKKINKENNKFWKSTLERDNLPIDS